MARFFRVDGLPPAQHTAETRQILENGYRGKKSDFTRLAYLRFAENRGFEFSQEMVKFIPLRKYNQAAREKPERYPHVCAFWWLKALPEFRYISLSALQRLIICQSVPSSS